MGGTPPRSSLARHRPSIPVLPNADARYRVLSDLAEVAVLLADVQTLRIVDLNASATHLTGYTRAELIGASVGRLVPPKDRAGQRIRIAAVTADVSQISLARFRRKDGSVIEVEIQQRRLDDGRVLAVVRRTGQRGLGEAEFSQMLPYFDLFVATVDREGRISYANSALSALTGWSVDELIGRSAHELLPVSGQELPLSNELVAGSPARPITTEIVTRSGERRLVAVSATLLHDPLGGTVGASILGQDITQERASQTALERELRERADIAAALARLQPGETTEVTARAICRELRGLGGVDLSVVLVFSPGGGTKVLARDAPQAISHEAGEYLPAGLSAYLIERAAMGPWVERWTNRSEYGELGAALTEVGLQSVSYVPIRYRDSTLGLVLVGSLNREVDGPILDNLPVIAEFGSAASALLAVELQADRVLDQRRATVHEIVKSRAFQPVFQPIVCIDTGEIAGYEALTRFSDGEPPDEHFSDAWSVGSGVELELATLSRSIHVGRQLPTGLWLNVNVSPRLLAHRAELGAILDEARRPLVLEITEHEVITDYQGVREALRKLSPLRIAVDDAGAGIANFEHIVELQPDFVKLDLGLVRGVDTDLARQAMIVAMRHYAGATHCQLIAEGVETRTEARTVAALGVAYGQGYWYGHPKAIDALVASPHGDLVTGRR